jgi:hypothetical protein
MICLEALEKVAIFLRVLSPDHHINEGARDEETKDQTGKDHLEEFSEGEERSSGE